MSTYAHIEEGISNYVLCLCARQVRYARAVCLRAQPVPRAATGVSPVSSLALVGARQLPIPLVAQDPTLGTRTWSSHSCSKRSKTPITPLPCVLVDSLNHLGPQKLSWV